MKKRVLNSLNKFLQKTINIRVINTAKQANLSHYDTLKRPETPRWLNIGAGMWAHPLWHNLDNPVEGYGKSFGLKSQQASLIKHDLMTKERLPFEDNSIEAIYCSHVIEHLNNAANKTLLHEVHRILHPNGYFRVTCPDLLFFRQVYERGDSELLAQLNSVPVTKFSNEQLFLNVFLSALSALTPPQGIKKVTDEEFRQLYKEIGCEETLNELSKRIPVETVAKYPRNHDSWHTEEKLITSLREAGMTKAYSSRYLQSQCKYMRDPNYFDYVHPYESLYVEAIK